MARKNKRFEGHQSIGVLAEPGGGHDCQRNPVATRSGHICLLCGRWLGGLVDLGRVIR